MEDPKTIELLLSVIFAKPQQQEQQGSEEDAECCYSESSLVNGITVLMALLEVRRLPPLPSATTPNMMSAGAGFSAATMFSAGGAENNNCETSTPEEQERQRALLDDTVQAILPRIEDFTRLLRAPPQKGVLRSSAGALDPPLGATRLSVSKLVVALLSTNNMDINRKFKELKTIDILLVKLKPFLCLFSVL